MGIRGQGPELENCINIKSFRDLRVWQLAMELVERVYRLRCITEIIVSLGKQQYALRNSLLKPLRA
jgi:hypothetical protein